MMWWAAWWVWGAFAIALVILEVFAPAYVFLGFGIGAAIVALFLLVGGPLAATVAGSLPLLLVAFALVSLVAWVGLRRLLGVTRTQVKRFDDDIND
jgi:membrane protein implicated in regulation of membrane protease activity